MQLVFMFWRSGVRTGYRDKLDFVLLRGVKKPLVFLPFFPDFFRIFTILSDFFTLLYAFISILPFFSVFFILFLRSAAEVVHRAGMGVAPAQRTDEYCRGVVADSGKAKNLADAYPDKVFLLASRTGWPCYVLLTISFLPVAGIFEVKSS
jgi:hypothetical protein